MFPLISSWKKLTTGSHNRQIFSAAITVALMTVMVKIVAAGKEFVVAWRFGTGDTLDAFFIAWLVPSFIIVVLASSLNAALIPTYIRVRDQDGREAAQRLFSGITLLSLGLVGTTTLLMVATAPLYLPAIARGFSSQKLALTFSLLCTLAPVVLLSAIVDIWGAVLNAGERFALAAITPAVTAFITMIFLLVKKDWGSFALAGGLLCGTVLEMVVLGGALKRQGISLRLRWYGFDCHLRQVTNQYAPMIAGALLMCSTSLVDQSMAAMLSPGSVAALNYGGKLIALPTTLITTALSTAVIPYFSQMVADGNWLGVCGTLKRYLSGILIATVPITVFFFFFSQPIVEVLLQRGSFTSQDTHVVAQIQAMYALQIPFYVAGILVVRLISAMQFNHILMWASGFNLIINIALNYLFIQWIGVQGIALSTSCVYAFSFTYVFLSVNSHLRRIVNEPR